MTQVIVIANQKGGVGKTTTVLNLGAALAELGYHTALVDLDPQAGLTATCGIDPYSVSRSTYTILTRKKASLVSVLRRLNERLFLLPGNSDLAAAEFTISKLPNPTNRLRETFMRNRLPLDFILIDTPPNLGLLTVNGLVAAQELLIPVQCQYMSMRGVRALLETVWLVHERLNPDLDLLGVLATMYRNKSELSQQVLGELQSVFDDKVFDVVIDDEDVVAEAPISSQSVLDYAPDSRAAAAYRAVAHKIAENGMR